MLPTIIKNNKVFYNGIFICSTDNDTYPKIISTMAGNNKVSSNDIKYVSHTTTHIP